MLAKPAPTLCCAPFLRLVDYHAPETSLITSPVEQVLLLLQFAAVIEKDIQQVGYLQRRLVHVLVKKR